MGSHGGPKGGPRGAQGGPRGAQGSPKMAQEGPKMAQLVLSWPIWVPFCFPLTLANLRFSWVKIYDILKGNAILMFKINLKIVQEGFRDLDLELSGLFLEPSWTQASAKMA